MEENENPWELNSFSIVVLVQTMSFPIGTSYHLSAFLSDPLFSSIVALYTLIFLYLPHFLVRILFSPVLILTALLLLALLRLGEIQRVERRNRESEETTHEEKNNDGGAAELESAAEAAHKRIVCMRESHASTKAGFDPNPGFEDSFVEWDVKAPLEVIYEEYEGEDEEDPRPGPNGKQDTPCAGIERYASLSLYYPESDSDGSSDGELPAIGNWDLRGTLGFKWEEEDREGLIEIALDGKRILEYQVEEDNLIEIDISPTRRNGDLGSD